jgi:MFS transporter, DHA1 family, multidrug resistance protein
MSPARQTSFVEFVALAAFVMMTTALAIDSMLPALDPIEARLGPPPIGGHAAVIVVFMFGFGIAQFFAGVFSDRYGRRGPMIGALLAYGVAGLMAAMAHSSGQLLAARFLQGMTMAVARVAISATIRDRYEGRRMAQVTSLTAMIFMAGPILAPSLGALVLHYADWRWLFAILALLGLFVTAWVVLRLPESLPNDRRRPISFRPVLDAARIVVTDRASVGYALGLMLMSGVVMSYLTAVQPIFQKTFHRPDLLPLAFAVVGVVMSACSLTNSRIVMWLGMRRIGHSALICLLLIALGHAWLAASGGETLVSFMALQGLMMGCFSLTTSNFSAMAMENMGAVAGSASSLQGSLTTIGGISLGATIAYFANGATLPLYLGDALCAAAALIVVFIAEGGRLFVARHVVELTVKR